MPYNLNFNNSKQMRIAKKLKGLVLKCDLFKTTEFLRFKGDSQYSTFTGGFCSIFIIILFAALFYNAVIATINKTKMMWAYNLIQTTNDQLQIITSTKSQAKFMVAVGINNLDMNSGQRYFDLRLSQFIQIGGVTTQKQIPLGPCQRDVWEGANQEILQIYDRYNFSKILCPPQNVTFEIKGSKIAYDYRYVKAYAVKCNDSLSSRPCANNTTLSNFLQSHQNFHLNFYFINGLLNPTSQQEITYYLEDRNFVPFNLVYGGSREVMLSRYNITTDQSISPFEDNRESKGGIATLPGIYLAASVFQGEYAGVYLKRSYITFDIRRNYTKMDSTMSYIGGLFGFFVIAFIFMQVYTQYSFQIEMGDKLYYYDQKTPFNANKFHFISFILYGLYNLCNFFGCSLNIQLMKKFDECRNQIQKQFDMAFLMKRIIFFQRSLRILFEDHQFKGLHMHDKMTLKEAQQLRSYYLLRDKIRGKLGQNLQNQSQYDRNSQGENSRSHELNFTENIIGKVVEQTLSPNFQNVQDINFKNFAYSRKVHPLNSKKFNKNQQNNSQATIHQNTIEMKRIESNTPNGIIQSNKVTLSSKIKILRKESQKGNNLSKKIFQGLDSTILRKILLKIEQKVEKQQNQISILENQNDFEIRISKRKEINEVRHKEEQKNQNILNIDQQKSEEQVSKVQIHSQYQQPQIPKSETLERESSKNQKNKIAQNLKDGDTFQYAI